EAAGASGEVAAFTGAVAASAAAEASAATAALSSSSLSTSHGAAVFLLVDPLLCALLSPLSDDRLCNDSTVPAFHPVGVRPSETNVRMWHVLVEHARWCWDTVRRNGGGNGRCHSSLTSTSRPFSWL